MGLKLVACRAIRGSTILNSSADCSRVSLYRILRFSVVRPAALIIARASIERGAHRFKQSILPVAQLRGIGIDIGVGGVFGADREIGRASLGKECRSRWS